MRSRPGCYPGEEGEGSRRPSKMMGCLLGMERARVRLTVTPWFVPGTEVGVGAIDAPPDSEKDMKNCR